MKIAIAVAAVLGVSCAMMHEARAADPVLASALAPVSVFAAKDIPDPEPGKPAWLPGATCSYGIAYYDQWVYVASQTEYILQFTRDPATAQLTYVGATAFAGYHSEKKNPNIRCRIHRLDDGHATLTILHGDDKTGFLWYAIDQDTGKLTAAGKQVPATFDHHNAPQLWMPDQQRFCVGGRTYDKIWWYRFAEDGSPIPDGSFALKNFSTGNIGMSSGGVMFSPDWRHMYCLVCQCPDDKDPKQDKTPQIDTYDMDPKSHAGTYVSSLELPFLGNPAARVSGALEPLSPDGKHLYAIFAVGPSSYYYVLARDPKTGTLTIADHKTETALRGVVGPPWSHPDRLAWAGDGRTGYFIYGTGDGPLGAATRDSETGALTILPPVADMGAQKLVIDPIHGNLFTVGEKIASFKIPAAAVSLPAR